MPNLPHHPHEAEAIKQFANDIHGDEAYGPYYGLNVALQFHVKVIDETGIFKLAPCPERDVAYLAFVPGWFPGDKQELSDLRFIPTAERGDPENNMGRHEKVVSNIKRSLRATDFTFLTEKFKYDGITGLAMRGLVVPEEHATPEACVVASILTYGDQLSRGVEADVYRDRLANLTSEVGGLAVVVQTEGFQSRVLYRGQEVECRNV